MMKKKLTRLFRLAAACSMLVIAFPANAQFAYNYLRAGDDYFRKGDYYSAAQYYEKYLSSNPSAKNEKFDPYTVANGAKEKKPKKATREEVVYKTGESYQLLNNYVKAEPFFKETKSLNMQFPLAKYWYAKSLRANSKFEEAESEFNAFIQEYTNADTYKDDAAKELKNLEFRRMQLQKKDIRFYTVDRMTINATGATSAPAIVNDLLVFSSTRPDSGDGNKNPFINRLYQSSLTEPGAVVKLNIPQAKDEHIEGASVSADGNKMYITKWTLKDSKKSAAIYVSTKQNGTWSEPVKLDNTVNSDGFSSQQPYISADNYLYYSSDKPGGNGKFDLWNTHINADGKPDVSINLGPAVNSKDDEYAPYLFSADKTLVFSSNGRTGMGGFDFYQAKPSESGWQEPVNLGYPVNSVRDDIYLVSTGSKNVTDNFYFSSDRSSECCLEMFSASKRVPQKRIAVIVLDCTTGLPLQGASVNMVDAGNKAVANETTNAVGRFEMAVEEYSDLKVTAQLQGYLPKSVNLNKPSGEFDTLLTSSVCIEKPPYVENKAVVIENVYFDFNKAILKPESYPVLDSVVAIMQRFPEMAIEVRGHTDSKGSQKLNLALSEARAKAFADYLTSKGIDSARLTSKGYGASIPIAPNKLPNGKDNPEGRDKNRRTEIKVLHY